MDFYPGANGITSGQQSRAELFGAARPETSEPGLLLIGMGGGVGLH